MLIPPHLPHDTGALHGRQGDVRQPAAPGPEGYGAQNQRVRKRRSWKQRSFSGYSGVLWGRGGTGSGLGSEGPPGAVSLWFADHFH
jgi:hypothetical protein